MATAAPAGAAKTPAQTYALIFGAVYLLVGILGFFVAGSFTGGSADDKLILFPVNHLHNIIHVALGAVLLGGSRSAAGAKTANTLVGVVLLLVAVLGFLGLDLMHTLINVQGSGDADNFLHLVTGGAALYFGTAGAAKGYGSTPAA